MIDRIVIENFKSLRRVALSLGRVNLFIGANASGKSNFLDALRVLQGIGNGFTVSEILDGKPKGATSEVWAGIRGGSARTCFVRADAERPDACVAAPDEVAMEVGGTLAERRAVSWDVVAPAIPASDPRLRTLDAWPTWRFLTRFSPATGRITRDRLDLGEHNIYDMPAHGSNSHAYASYDSGLPGMSGSFRVDVRRPVFGQFVGVYGNRIYNDFPREHPELVGRVGALLANAQRVEPTPELLRRYSDAPEAQRMGDHGENFAALIHTVCQDSEAKDAYVSWLRELRPEEVDDVGVLAGALGESLFMITENGREFPAPVLSDGTLRFAALAAAFFQPDMPSLVTIEEIENGLHPSRLRLLLELLRSQAERRDVQVIATTHSPRLLEWLEEEEYATTFFCRRDEETGATEIRPLTEVPDFMDVVRKPDQRISDLFAEGWFEGAL